MTKKEQHELTPEILKSFLSYDQETGYFTWLVSSGRSAKGNIAGTVRADKPSDPARGYRYIRVAGARYAAHRLAWFYVHGKWPKGDVDHRDMVRDNNRIGNLRDASRGQNMANIRRPAHNTSGYKGVIVDRGGWQAQIQFNRQCIKLGYFDSAEEAHKAYCRKAQELFGEFFRAA